MKALVEKKSKKYGLQFELVCSVILQESAGNPWAMRYEDGFYHRYISKLTREDLPGYVPTSISLDTEKRQRSFSFGLMQLMGETMREIGYTKPDLSRLLIPAVNLEYGCRFLKKCINRAETAGVEEVTRSALSAYNTGRLDHTRTTYDDKILSHMESESFMSIFRR